MAKAKEGDLYGCEECGMIVCVEDPCGCSACEIICCDVPMKKKTGTTRKKKVISKAKAAPRKAKAIKK
jgi:hypothetical protein